MDGSRSAVVPLYYVAGDRLAPVAVGSLDIGGTLFLFQEVVILRIATLMDDFITNAAVGVEDVDDFEKNMDACLELM